MTLHRFLVIELPSQGVVTLPDDEAHHASRVLRCSVGDKIVLFDGRGNEALAQIEFLDKRSVRATVEHFQFAPRDHEGRLHFAVALPKGDRQRNTIEKLVELGVDSLTPLTTVRSVAVVKEEQGERLHRYGIEACKQCGRNRAMVVHPAQTVAQLAAASHSGLWVLHPRTDSDKTYSIHRAFDIVNQSKSSQLLFVVGPEGGLTDEEVDLLVSHHGQILSLGERIQRVETAVATAAVLGHCWLGEV